MVAAFSIAAAVLAPQITFAEPKGDAVTVGSIYGGVKTAVTGKGPAIGRLADLEEEAIARVKSALSSSAFILPVQNGSYIPPQLAVYMSQAAANNPEIKAMRSEIAAMEQKVLMAGAPMMPEMEIMLMDYPVKWPWEMNSPMAAQRVTLSHPFYSYGKRAAKEKIAAYDVELMKLSIAQMEYKMAGEVVGVYFDLAEVAVNIEMLEKRDDLLGVMEEIALLMYEIGKAPMSEVLAVQTMRSDLKAMRIEMETMRAEMTAMLAGMLGISESELVPVIEVAESVAAETPISRDLIVAEAANRHPETAWLKTWDLQLLEAARLAEKNYHPDYRLTFQYDFRLEMADRFGIGIMFDLPVYQRRMQDAEFKEAMAMREQIPLKEESIINRIRSKSAAEFSKLALTLDRIEKYENEIIPLAQSGFDSALAGYQVGKTEFAVLVAAEVRLLDYETARRVAIVSAGRAKAELFYITLGAVDSAAVPTALIEENSNENGGGIENE